MDARLDIAGDPEPIFETDDRALIEREQVCGLIAEVAAAQVRCKSVRQPKIAVVPRDRHRGGQVDEVQVDLHRSWSGNRNVLSGCRVRGWSRRRGGGILSERGG